MPNPSECWMASSSLSCMTWREVYLGRSSRLKQVWATGRYSSPPPVGWMIICNQGGRYTPDVQEVIETAFWCVFVCVLGVGGLVSVFVSGWLVG